MKLGAAGAGLKKPIIPKTREQKERISAEQSVEPKQDLASAENVEGIIAEVEKVYGQWFRREEIEAELKRFNYNKSAALSKLLKDREENEKIEQRMTAMQFQATSLLASTSNQSIQERAFSDLPAETVSASKAITNLFGYESLSNSKPCQVTIPLTLLMEIQDNFSRPRPIEKKGNKKAPFFSVDAVAVDIEEAIYEVEF